MSNENDFFYSLPMNIQNLIYEYDSTYKCKFDIVLQELPLEAVIFRINAIYFNYYSNHGYDSLIEGFIEYIYDPEFVLTTLKKCKCEQVLCSSVLINCLQKLVALLCNRKLRKAPRE